ncbi:MAG: AAA family ATPase [Roseiflexaceae bacterium]|nr:AAA family ATPase [Roseiflexaceae bacterium]
MQSNNLLRVTRIRVVNLFGRYTHDVQLRTDDRVTIIHGPNGVGKTVLLRLTEALLSGKMFTLVKTPFQTFEVTLSDGSVLGIERDTLFDEQTAKNRSPARCYLRRDERETSHELQVNDISIRRLASRIEQALPWLIRVDEDSFLDRRSGEMLTSAEILEQFADFLPSRSRKHESVSEPDWMRDIRNSVRVHLIEAQRLLRFSEQRRWGEEFGYTATVKTYAQDLQKRIAETLAKYAKESQALDQSFPQRLLQNPIQTLSTPELKTRMQDLEEKRQRLKRIGLIDEDPTYPFDITTLEMLDETRRAVMTLYVQDTEHKLGVLDDLANRIEILLGTINKKFTHKSIVIDKQKGFIAKTDQDRLLELDALSSGEQHELVLLYDLLFRVQPNTLVLIDEPELSLHVTWQKSFVTDLLEIVSIAGYDVVLATHSPFIVGDRHDLMVPLLPERESEVEIDA